MPESLQAGTPAPLTPDKSANRFRIWLFRVITVIGVFLVMFLLSDLAMRITPGIFSMRTQNIAFSRYGSLPGDMYFSVPSLRMYYMYPNVKFRAFWNGYFWIHETDSYEIGRAHV